MILISKRFMAAINTPGLIPMSPSGMPGHI
jgi:hypothetical protein